MNILHCVNGFESFDFKTASVPSCPFLLCEDDNIYLMTGGIYCEDVPGRIKGSGVVENGKIAQWFFEDFPETPDEFHYKVSCAFLGK